MCSLHEGVSESGFGLGVCVFWSKHIRTQTHKAVPCNLHPASVDETLKEINPSLTHNFFMIHMIQVK